MKTIPFILILLFASIGLLKAQELPLDFESGTYEITDFDGGDLTVIDNPQSAGINTSAKVAQMVKNAGEIWGGSYITLPADIDFSNGKIFTMKIFSPKAGINVLLKVENASDSGINFEKEVATTVANEWEVLSFDFNGLDASQAYRKVVLIFELGTVGDGSPDFTYLIDDITLLEGDMPTTVAPTPPAYDASKVISIFSESFESIDGTNFNRTNFNPYWGQTTVGTIEEILGTEVLKFASLNYQGIELPYEVNAAAMVYLHVDVWTADETTLDIYPISRTTGEKKASLTPLVQNEWNSFDIKLSDLTTQGFNLADLYQLKLIGSGGKTVFVDNLYFYDDNTEPDTEVPTDFTATLSTVTYNSIKLLMNANDNSGAVNYNISVGGTNFVVGGASGVEKSYEFTQLPSSTEFTFEITADDLSGNSATNNPITIVVTTDDAFPMPELASPVPPVLEPSNVVSIFSDSYTNVPNTNFNPWWQQSTWFFSVQVGGNEVLKYENFNYQGIELGNQVDVSEMLYLHVDVWTPNETLLNISPISASTGEKAYKLPSINLNEWNSYDIPLTSFTIQGLSLIDIGQLKLVGSGKSIIYIDNIYFHKENLLTVSEIDADNDVNYYPNPVMNELNLYGVSEINRVDVYEITGKRVKSININALNASIDLGELEQGHYVIIATLSNGKQSVQKIVKQ